ncbi:MAG: hypothetical protein GF350_11060 [Chitinivibrionales bacterium]|nr:hypothetical protein [Chitinivibrionales bacterium]
MRTIRNIAFILLAGISLGEAFNHPEIEWKTVSTRHFYIHFYDRTRSAVYAAAKIAEESYGPLARMYRFAFNNRIHISLASYEDKANGLAGWTEDNIMIWLPDARMDMRSNTTWLRNVITHELAHIISLRKRGFQLLALVPGFSYTSPSHAIDAHGIIPATQFFPPWFVEGIAQRESERQGHDCWGSRRDMVLRCAVLGGSYLTLQEMGAFNHNSMENEMVYNQGYSFVKHIEAQFGAGKIADICSEGRGLDFGGASFNRTFRRATGKSLRNVYDAWIDSLENVYQARDSRMTKDSGTILWNKGFFSTVPRVCAETGQHGFLTNHKSDRFRTDLVLFGSGAAEPAVRIPWAKTTWCFGRSGKKVFYVKSREPNENGSFFNEMYEYDIIHSRETRLTENGRVYDVALLDKDSRLLCVRFVNDAFSLAVFDCRSQSFSSCIDGEMGNPFAGVSVSPGDRSNRAVVGRVVNGNANLYLVDIAAGTLEPLCRTAAQEETPFWGTDNRIYYSADYDGVFNVYSIRPDGSDLRRHSSVRGGMFHPVHAGPDEVLCSEYRAGGFSIVALRGRGTPYELPEQTVCVFEPLPEPDGSVKLRARDYDAERLRPAWQANAFINLLDINGSLGDLIGNDGLERFTDSIQTVLGGGIGFYKSDALMKRNKQFGISLALMSATRFESQDSTAIDTATQFRNSLPGRKQSMIRASPALQRTTMFSDKFRTFGYTGSVLRSNRGMQTDTTGQDTSTVEEWDWYPLVIPEIMVENRKPGPTIGFVFQSQVMVYLPLLVYFNPYIQWHIARDWYIGISPEFQLLQLMALSAQFPFRLSWSTHQYINEDISYNYAGLSQAGAALVPMIIPVEKLTGTVDSTKSEIVHKGGFSVQAYGMHAFPLGKYRSLLLRAELYPVWISEIVEDPFDKIAGASDFYISADMGTEFIFPLFQTINRGNRFCADALYGKVIYELSLHGNRQFFSSSFPGALGKKDYDTTAVYAAHRIGIGASFGYVRSYTFFRQLVLRATWDIWRNRLAVTARIGM